MDTFKPTLRQRLRLLVTQPMLAFSATVPGITFYGGATITRCHDATGALYTVACAKDNASGAFGLYVINGNTPILIRPVSGRGSVWVSLYDGMAYWVGWQGSSDQGGPIPGFAPFPSLLALAEQIASLAGIVAGLPPTTTGPIVRIPARNATDGALLELQAGAGEDWAFNVGATGVLRLTRGGEVVERWPK
jgi:hypothetical protein